MKYSISLDLLLASAQASLKGKHKSAARFYDAALHAKDFQQTVAALEKSQTEALIAMKKAKAEQAKAAPAVKKPAPSTTAAPTVAKTPGQRMTAFLEEIAKNREDAAKKGKKATKKMAKKKVKANPDTKEFNNTIDEMTQANSADSVLDPSLDLVDDGEDGGGGNPGDAISRETPSVTKSEEADIGDPSNGMGESELDTDLDDAMDLDDLSDLTEEDFLSAADEDLFDDSDDNLEDDVEMASDDDSDDSDDDSEDDGDGDDDDGDSDEDDDGGNPFAQESKTKATAKKDSKSVKARISRTIHNLAALDRLTATTSMLVEGKKPAKSAKPASKK